MSVFIIAEAGVNHNGDEGLAFALVDAACAAGADAVKFQTFKANKLVTEQAKQADYQIVNTGLPETQREMLERLELDYEAHHRLLAYCLDKDIEFMSSAFDTESLNFLVKELGLKRLKIASGEITNAPFILEHARSGCDLIVSTGMSSLAEIEAALAVIAFGLTSTKEIPPSEDAFQGAYASREGRAALIEKVTLLHCTTEYPTPPQEVNLLAMKTLCEAFKIPVGYSDHTEGTNISIAASALGATVIEKHFTLDRKMPGPDHKASLEPDELASLIRGIREIEDGLGTGIKVPTISEAKNKDIARKTVVASRQLSKGQRLIESDLALKRSSGGISPFRYWDLIGKVTKRSYSKGDSIDE